MIVLYRGKYLDILDAIALAHRYLIELPDGVPGIAWYHKTGVVDYKNPGIFVITDARKPRKYKVEADDLEDAVCLWNAHTAKWADDFL